MTATTVSATTEEALKRLPSPSLSPEGSGVAEEEEASLLARIRVGDEEAYATLVRRHAGALLAVARRFLDCQADCDDAVQDAFVSAFQSLDTFAGNARLGTWLHRIIVNHCLMKLRQRKRRRTVSLDGLLPTFDETGHHTRPVSSWGQQPEARLSQAETCAQVRACIHRLPEPFRVVLLLRDIEERDTDETAALLNISRAAVKTRLHRARQALRTLLEPVFAAV